MLLRDAHSASYRRGTGMFRFATYCMAVGAGCQQFLQQLRHARFGRQDHLYAAMEFDHRQWRRRLHIRIERDFVEPGASAGSRDRRAGTGIAVVVGQRHVLPDVRCSKSAATAISPAATTLDRRERFSARTMHRPAPVGLPSLAKNALNGKRLMWPFSRFTENPPKSPVCS